MDLLSRLFGSSDARLTKRIVNETGRRVIRATKPLTDLATAIVSASQACYENLKPQLLFRDERHHNEQEFALFGEFMFFFIHLTMRFAASQMNAKQIELLQSFLGPSLADVTVGSFCGHWPQELKAKIKSEFYDNLNQAEAEYSRSTELFSEEKPFTGDSLFSKLGRNVAELTGHSMNPATITMVVTAAVFSYKEINLASLVREASKVLSEPTNHDIIRDAIEFWTHE